MLTLIAQIDTKKILETTGLDFNMTADFVEKFKAQSIAVNYKTPPENIFLYRMSPLEETRYLEGDDHTVVWDKDTITGLDFSVEDSKKTFSISVIPAVVTIGETVTVTVKLFENDGITPLSTINTQTRVPVQTSTGRVSIAMQFINGVATKVITPPAVGVYIIGAKRYLNSVILHEVPTLEVDL